MRGSLKTGGLHGGRKFDAIWEKRCYELLTNRAFSATEVDLDRGCQRANEQAIITRFDDRLTIKTKKVIIFDELQFDLNAQTDCLFIRFSDCLDDHLLLKAECGGKRRQ